MTMKEIFNFFGPENKVPETKNEDVVIDLGAKEDDFDDEFVETVVGVSGHRHMEHDTEVIKDEVTKRLIEFKAKKVYTGMALGFDLLCAEVCIELGIPFVAAVPFANQESAWMDMDKKRYHALLAQAESIAVVCTGPYHVSMYHRRNEYIVKKADKMLFYLNETTGGTAACAKLAIKKFGAERGGDIVNIVPSLPATSLKYKNRSWEGWD